MFRVRYRVRENFQFWFAILVFGTTKSFVSNSIWIFGFVISHLEVNERLVDLILEKESLEDVGDLAVVTQLSNHVVEVGNLIGDVWLAIFMSP